MTESTIGELIAEALTASHNAHCPYSNFHVGAALLSSDGRIFLGCNVENVSYGLTICAERSAIFSAIAAGARTFTAMAIVADGDTMPYPCGACRQVLSEFCAPDFPIHIASANTPNAPETCTLGELLPKSFTFKKW